MRRSMVLVLVVFAAVATGVTGIGGVGAVAAAPVPAMAAPVRPLDVGGSRNFLGTGGLLDGNGNGTGFEAEGFGLAVNAYCTDRVQGDRYQSGWVGGTCTGTRNPDYRPGGYTYAIDVPAGRTSPLEVWLADARYSTAPLGGPTGTEAALDRSLANTNPEAFTFTLHGPDATPADDHDNPVACSRTFAAATPFEFSFLGSGRWNRMPCDVAVADPAGRYLLRVTNAGDGSRPASGVNQFGIVAAYASDGDDPVAVLCDRRTDPACPVVKAAGPIGISALGTTPLARFDLAEVAASEAGRTLRVSLFDPGEGGTRLRLLAPTGPETWSPVSFAWRDDGGASGSGSALSVTESRFNGRVVDLTVDLTGYDPPAGNTLWKVQYEFTFGVVTDRTTWDVAVGGLEPSRIVGTVSADSPVEGGTVYLVRPDDAWPSAWVTVGATGATSGSFTFPAVSPGVYQLYVTPPMGSALQPRWVGGSGDRASASRFVATGDGAPVRASVTLAPGAVLSGRVADGAAGVSGATVRVMGRGELWVPRAQVVTGVDGSWTAAGLGKGDYEIQVVPPAGSSLRPRWFDGSATRTGATPVAVAAGEVRSGLDVALADAGMVSGRLTGPGDAPVANARVVLFGPNDTWVGSLQVTTGADGRYAVTGVDPASYQVRFVPPPATGWAAVWFEGGPSRVASTPVLVTAGATVADVDARVGP